MGRSVKDTRYTSHSGETRYRKKSKLAPIKEERVKEEPNEIPGEFRKFSNTRRISSIAEFSDDGFTHRVTELRGSGGVPQGSEIKSKRSYASSNVSKPSRFLPLVQANVATIKGLKARISNRVRDALNKGYTQHDLEDLFTSPQYYETDDVI